MCKVNSSLYLQRDQSVPPTARRRSGDRTHWIPNTDVFDNDGTLVIKVELAGMQREHLELSIQDRRLVIRGERSDEACRSKCKFLVMEINYGPFECIFEIPPEYDLAQAQASYTNGFLRIDVPKAVVPSSDQKLALSSEKA